jgi:hypothetical protein
MEILVHCTLSSVAAEKKSEPGFTGLSFLTMPHDNPFVGEKHRILDPGTTQHAHYPMLRPPSSTSTRRWCHRPISLSSGTIFSSGTLQLLKRIRTMIFVIT